MIRSVNTFSTHCFRFWKLHSALTCQCIGQNRWSSASKQSTERRSSWDKALHRGILMLCNSGCMERRVGGQFDVRETSCLKSHCAARVSGRRRKFKLSWILWNAPVTCVQKYRDVYLRWSPAASPFFSFSSCPVRETKRMSLNEMRLDQLFLMHSSNNNINNKHQLSWKWSDFCLINPVIMVRFELDNIIRLVLICKNQLVSVC